MAWKTIEISPISLVQEGVGRDGENVKLVIVWELGRESVELGILQFLSCSALKMHASSPTFLNPQNFPFFVGCTF
jgi:hypothetical protein